MFNPPFKYTQTCELNNSERLEDAVGSTADDVDCIFANADGSVSSVIRRSPPHPTSTIQRSPRAHTRLPEPTSISGRARPSGNTGERPTLIGRPATNLQRRRPTPDAPARPPGGARQGLKTSPGQAPPAPPTRPQWATEGRGAHNDPSPAGRELGDNRHMHGGRLRSD